MALAVRGHEAPPWGAHAPPRYHPTLQMMSGDAPMGRNAQRRTIDYAGTVIRMVQVGGPLPNQPPAPSATMLRSPSMRCVRWGRVRAAECTFGCRGCITLA
jgi:hypothetical protein